MLVLSEETQVQQFDIKIGISTHNWIVAYLHLVLYTELPCRRVEKRCIVGSIVLHVYTYLYIERVEPCTMLIKVTI